MIITIDKKTLKLQVENGREKLRVDQSKISKENSKEKRKLDCKNVL